MKGKDQGAKRLHIIDLDAAFSTGDNAQTVADIARASGLPVQVGGGIRTVNAAEKLLKLGIDYIIFGALAFSDPEAILQIQKKFGSGSVIVALDNKDGKEMVEGWKTQTAFTMGGAREKFAKLG